MSVAPMVLLLCAGAGMGAAQFGFRRWTVRRPSVGVLNLSDVVLMLVALGVVPYLYLALPRGLAGGVLALMALSLLPGLLEPVVGSRMGAGAVALLLLGADIVASLYGGSARPVFLVVNNALLVLIVAGVANLWVQSGLRARDAAILAGGLTAYGWLAASQTALLSNIALRCSGVPLAPVVTWGASGGACLGLGLGELLVCCIFPLVLRKAFGRAAAVGAALSILATVGAVLALQDSGTAAASVPATVVLGPVVIAQTLYWRWRAGGERTMREYWQEAG